METDLLRKLAQLAGRPPAQFPGQRQSDANAGPTLAQRIEQHPVPFALAGALVAVLVVFAGGTLAGFIYSTAFAAAPAHIPQPKPLRAVKDNVAAYGKREDTDQLVPLSIGDDGALLVSVTDIIPIVFEVPSSNGTARRRRDIERRDTVDDVATFGVVMVGVQENGTPTKFLLDEAGRIITRAYKQTAVSVYTNDLSATSTVVAPGPVDLVGLSVSHLHDTKMLWLKLYNSTSPSPTTPIYVLAVRPHAPAIVAFTVAIRFSEGLSAKAVYIDATTKADLSPDAGSVLVSFQYTS